MNDGSVKKAKVICISGKTTEIAVPVTFIEIGLKGNVDGSKIVRVRVVSVFDLNN